jgi:hypothetical protein
MAHLHRNAELANIRDFLQRLESGQLKLVRGLDDVTKEEISILKREIAFLEKRLARLKAKAAP